MKRKKKTKKKQNDKPVDLIESELPNIIDSSTFISPKFAESKLNTKKVASMKVKGTEPTKVKEQVKMEEPVKVVEPVKMEEPVKVVEPVKVEEKVKVAEPVKVDKIEEPENVEEQMNVKFPAKVEKTKDNEMESLKAAQKPRIEVPAVVPERKEESVKSIIKEEQASSNKNRPVHFDSPKQVIQEVSRNTVQTQINYSSSSLNKSHPPSKRPKILTNIQTKSDKKANYTLFIVILISIVFLMSCYWFC